MFREGVGWDCRGEGEKESYDARKWIEENLHNVHLTASTAVFADMTLKRKAT